MQPNPKKVNTTDAKAKMLAGVETLYKAVSSTLGPRSANVAIKRPFGAPAVVHDGVTVARACLPLEDPEEDTGAEIVFDAAEKTGDVGDGTTTATVLCREIAVNAHKYITAGAKTMALREGIELATDGVIKELGAAAQPIEADDPKLLMVATVSAQNAEIGGMVADAYKELGKEGILTVEESRTTESSLELKQGMQFDRGWVSPYFITQGNTLEEAVLENPYILVTDIHLRDMERFTEMLIRLVNEEKVQDLVIIADRIEPQIIALYLKNHLKGAIRGLMVTAPSFGEKRIDMLKDIAIVTGAKFVSESTGTGLESVTKEMLGHAKRVTSTKDTTLIVDGGGNQKDIEVRIAELKEKSTNSDFSAFDREKFLERLARLHSGVGVLTIGAKSEPELKERKERAIDSISAAKAALDGGIVPGGGMALIAAAQSAEKALAEELAKCNDDVRAGARLVFQACRAPFNKLLTNAGFDPGEYWAKVAAQPVGYGVDVMDGEVTDMLEAGIIDPVMVVSAALGHASSAAVALATSDTVITEKPKQTKEQG